MELVSSNLVDWLPLPRLRGRIFFLFLSVGSFFIFSRCRCLFFFFFLNLFDISVLSPIYTRLCFDSFLLFFFLTRWWTLGIDGRFFLYLLSNFFIFSLPQFFFPWSFGLIEYIFICKKRKVRYTSGSVPINTYAHMIYYCRFFYCIRLWYRSSIFSIRGIVVFAMTESID